MKVLVTGSSGFIASHLMPALLNRGWHVRGAVRGDSALKKLTSHIEGTIVGELGPETDWSLAVSGMDVVVHLAARVHLMRDSDRNAYERANVLGSRKLAEDAAAAGVRRLVFVSSVKAMGEASPEGRPWREDDRCCPEDDYGKSKLAAELVLSEIAARTNMQIVILRPAVVYGPGMVANMYALFRIVDRGLPLPLASVENRRSLIYVGNFADAIIKVVERPRVSGETFLVSDGQDLSTPELIRATARALGRPARLFPVPPRLLRLIGRVAGKSEEVNRLASSLTVDISKIGRLLGWRPPFAVDEGLAKTAQWFRQAGKQGPSVFTNPS